MIFLWHVFWFASSYKIDTILANPLQVEIDNGLVEGRQLSSSLFAWSGIPFAKPPVGELRFELPMPVSNWEDVWNATFERNQCVQTLLGEENYIGDEDYQLVSEDVIVVTFNYRLGILGFAFTDDDAMPGNLGLKDQICALQWVQRNIEAFGGDKNTVTIFGQSAGAASVAYLVMSPSAKDLFHRAIIQSGSTLCLWSLSKVAREATFKTGRQLGIITISSRYLIDQLRTIPVSNLQNASMTVVNAYLLEDPLNGLVFAPVIEPASTVNPITTTSTYADLLSGFFNRVPLLMGFTSFEALAAESMIDMWYLYLLQYQILPSRLVPDSMNVFTIIKPIVGSRIQNHYAGATGSIIFPGENFLHYMSDNEFVRPIEKMARLTCPYTPTYFYKFSYRHDPTAAGVGHAGELPYIFNSPYNNPNDIITKNRMVRMWTNFAKTANPTPTEDPVLGNYVLPTVTPQIVNYIDIDNNLTIAQNPNKVDVDFWSNLFRDFANPPFITY
ncbi:Carboxylesterase family [Popillia japonica]|uniref:Carboxylic ester hydrolase n=1 Tax=Popillia japonica TaxID=7064 RepID=A0AAW1L905_POPJA